MNEDRGPRHSHLSEEFSDANDATELSSFMRETRPPVGNRSSSLSSAALLGERKPPSEMSPIVYACAMESWWC